MMSTDEAMSIVVQGVVAYTIRRGIQWEDYPEIGESDWEEIQRRALAVMVPPVTFHAAYKIIAARAQHEGPSEEGPV